MQDIAHFLASLIQKETITPNECGIYELIKSHLSDFKVIRQDSHSVKNIFLYKDFRTNAESNHNNSPLHLCFAGHIDVVPSGDGWEYAPFAGIINDNIIYGRGAQDMKGGIASFIYALKEINDFNGILSVLLTSDEEGDGIYGTKVMLEHLREINLLPTFALVAEPTCINNIGDSVKIGRRGSINGVLKIQGMQGHTAYPHKCANPINLIALILPHLADKTLDNGDNDFDKSRIVITDIRAGMEVTNVTPNELKLMFNVRNNPQTTQDSIRSYIDSIVRDFIGRYKDSIFNANCDMSYSLELKQSSYPFITHSATLIEAISNAIYKHTNIIPHLNTGGGTSDARYFSQFGVDVVEFGMLNDKIHAINECVKIDDLVKCKMIFVDFIKNLHNAKC